MFRGLPKQTVRRGMPGVVGTASSLLLGRMDASHDLVAIKFDMLL
ncbi:hypothetical protein B8V81_1819 [Paenibacillus pasadenensis]|uniref:Uncharacterized protein n=1 Tax=Paenibacillus pasadenensis TaxID=217090 RepID=A0A2N5NB97_9BACL|nr:hypothetical protein B8V81_1819 [Paenibacillus pasadenensis]